MLKIFSGLNPIIFIKNFFPVMAFAFSTSTSNATIPMNIDTLAEKMGVSKKISSFTIPLGATINMDGTSIMQGVAVVFTAQAFGGNASARSRPCGVSQGPVWHREGVPPLQGRQGVGLHVWAAGDQHLLRRRSNQPARGVSGHQGREL